MFVFLLVLFPHPLSFLFSQPVTADLFIWGERAEKAKRIRFWWGTNRCTHHMHVWMWNVALTQTHAGLHLTCHKAAVGCVYWTRSVCLNQMTNRVQGPPLVHSCLINTLLLGLFSSKELSYGCSSTLDQCYEQCRQTAAKQTGPCLERPATAPAPPDSDRSPNGGLHWGPWGPLTTKQAPKDSTPFSPQSL